MYFVLYVEPIPEWYYLGLHIAQIDLTSAKYFFFISIGDMAEENDLLMRYNEW